ncbi:MAG: hypothetical protein P8N09_03430 [Planctomycetota bacterium]|nr:hypothetical protein [Planctomycetota bacterium]
MNSLLATLILLSAQFGAHSSAVPHRVTLPQDSTPAVPAQEAASPAPSAARDLLEKAARFQRGDTPRPAPPGLHGVFQVHVRNPEDDSAIDARVERTYLRHPVRMRTTRQDNLVDSNSTVGYDGERSWFRDNASGKVVVYSDDPLTFDVDLEQLQAQLRLMPVMLDAFVLDALMPRMSEIRLDGDRVDLPVGSRGKQTASVQWVVGHVEDTLFGVTPDAPPPTDATLESSPQLQVALAIEPETGKLWNFRVRTLGGDEPREIELRFFFHVASDSELVVPAYTAVYRDGDAEPFITLGMIVDPDTGKPILSLDPIVDDKLFEVPD